MIRVYGLYAFLYIRDILKQQFVKSKGVFMSFESNVYSAPKSDLNVDDSTGLNYFTRFSAWGVFGLSVITLGIYWIYWLYNRSNIINSFHPNKIASWLIIGFVTAYIINSLSSIVDAFVPANPIVAIVTLLSSLGYFVLYIMLVFGIRSRLSTVLGTSLNGFLVFFFSALYFQYKINEAIDSRATPQN